MGVRLGVGVRGSRRAGLAATLAGIALPLGVAPPGPDLAPPPVTGALSPSGDTVPAPAHVGWRPERPAQGALFVLRVTPAPGTELTGVSGRAGGEELHFSPVDGGAMESLAPVPVDASDTLVARLEVRYASGVADSLGVSVPVSARYFHHERLEVAPELGSPLSAENGARLARDQAKAREVSRDAERTGQLWTHHAVLPRDDRITGGFGDGRIFNGQVSSRHMGLDLDGDPGDTVVAAARGVVALVDRFLLAGNIVYLNHGAGLISGYFHLSRQLVQEGDTVEAGTPIGLVGATGRVTGPHLHWVVRYGTTSVDPGSLLPALEAGR